jgi:uncharacterized protein (TIGR03032 family)
VSIGLERLGTFETVATDGFAEWLADNDVAVAFGRQDAFVMVGRTPGDELRVDTLDLSPVGAAVALGRTLWMATPFQLWRFEDGLERGSSTDAGHDAVLLPRVGATIGGTQVADLALLADGTPVMASHRFSALVTVADGLSFRPLWLPRWVSALAPDERSPVSGVAVRDGVLAAVTLLGCDDEPGLWRDGRADGGAIVDVGSDEVIANGLSMPFSPRSHEGRLWFTQAGTGELCVVDADDSVTPVIGLPTFLRGLAFVGPYAVVAGSSSRSQSLVEGLPVGDRLSAAGERPAQGLFVVDTRSGELVHRLAIEGTGREIPTVVALPGMRRPTLMPPNDSELQMTVAYDHSWDPASARPPA